MVKPERRTKGDVLAAVVIAAVVAVVAGLIWWTSDARATISRAAATPVPNLTPAKAVAELAAAAVDSAEPEDHPHRWWWRASVISGDGREVQGRDPATGNTLWSYGA